MPTAAVIVNPTKVSDPERLRAQARAVFESHGWAEPLWFETTARDTGRGQALEAVQQGADLICPYGGDGTVRAVASGALGSGVPLGLLSAGTGNLLARNMKLPHRRFQDGLTAALTGRPRPIDVMRVTIDRDGDDQWAEPEYGLVMTGFGLDADILGGTPDALKARLSWLAYPVNGLRHVRHDHTAMTVTFDDDQPVDTEVTTVIVGSCGLLTGGVQLMPNARFDDGELDAVLIRAGGLLGWPKVVVSILGRSKRSSHAVERRVARAVELRAGAPTPIEIDGDHLGSAIGLRIEVLPSALTVRS
ncbi:diacylglycerol kinase family enzyme [Branchiibius hedensis]|uniref:Diacylglycerol kinase family enzyme n=1 Tax=Branchiibius hedensis TaxID=672460 RepID=A0A2Y8ZUM5_9MICO|nr:diacylglycerol kinase family protein [Branchiibius hedensis]PWJ27250.1 diacylglycerol kinase family enzyme [Branchiibius hedensis]SSA36061.1 Diacylglycerol kinase family enzyme [Branchiibius hedensis]